MKAPWNDYLDKEINEGDTILQPSGQKGIVVYHEDREEPTDAWCVKYDDKIESRLCLQICDSGMCIVV